MYAQDSDWEHFFLEMQPKYYSIKSFKITFGTFFTVQKNYKCNEYECIFTYWKLEQMVGQNINYQKCGKTINNKCEKFLRLIVLNGCASSIVHADSQAIEKPEL